MSQLKSEGECRYCEKTFDTKGISRHLATHLKKMAAESKVKANAYHVKVSAGEMFLHLLVGKNTTLGDLDLFLRRIWLECCGHMSSFKIKGKHYDFDFDTDEFGERMSTKIAKLYKKGLNLEYEYDFGSTTYLAVKMMNEYPIAVPEGILLLSRNEPLPILCHSCKKKPAEVICSVHVYDGECLFCASCAKKHRKECSDFADYAQMPIVNSPRMGICAYEGGDLDKKRDGAWKG